MVVKLIKEKKQFKKHRKERQLIMVMKKMMITMMVLEWEEVQVQVMVKSLNIKAKETRNNKIQFLMSKHVDFVEDLIRILMRNLLIFTIGKNVQCLHNVGSVVKSLKYLP